MTDTQRLERLMRRPSVWRALTPYELERVAIDASWYLARTSGGRLRARFFEHVAEAISAVRRREIVAVLAGSLERLARAEGTCVTEPLDPWLRFDPDVGVISSAALAIAQLTPLADADPLTGPRRLTRHALKAKDPDREGAILLGLARLGDARVLRLIDDVWHRVSEGARLIVLQHLGSSPASVAHIEFLVGRLDESRGGRDAASIGQIAASLLRLGTAATLRLHGSSEFHRYERVFPSWSLSEDKPPVIIQESFSASEMAQRIQPHLQWAAHVEAYPRVIPAALRGWGLPDDAFIATLRRAVEDHAPLSGPPGLLPEFIPIEMMPDWEREDAVIEWGILNPFGSTKVQICLISLEPGLRVLTYARHHPTAPLGLILGTLRSEETKRVEEMLLALADRFVLGEAVLLQSLPHWTRIAPGILDMDAAAAFFRIAHRKALAAEMTADEDVKEQTRKLETLRKDPSGTIGRQVAQMFEAFFVDPPVNTQRSDSADYDAWFAEASRPDHVATVSGEFTKYWGAAFGLWR